MTNEYYLWAGTWYAGLDGLCRLEAGTERLLTPLPIALCAPEAIIESVLWLLLLAADSEVVFPKAIRLMTSAVARGGSDTYEIVSLSNGPRNVIVRLYCST